MQVKKEIIERRKEEINRWNRKEGWKGSMQEESKEDQFRYCPGIAICIRLNTRLMNLNMNKIWCVFICRWIFLTRPYFIKINVAYMDKNKNMSTIITYVR